MATLNFKQCSGQENECQQLCEGCRAAFTQAKEAILEAIGWFEEDEHGAGKDLAVHLSEFIQMDEDALTMKYTGNLPRKTSP